MPSENDGIPAKRGRIEGREKTEIPAETMLEVLLWLDRFDLDAKQITTKSLRSLVEKNKMPLRKVDQVDYEGEELGPTRSTDRKAMLSIVLVEKEEVVPTQKTDVKLQIETDADVRRAVSYLSSCFVSCLGLYGHEQAPPNNAIVAAPALIRQLHVMNCNFYNGKEDVLSQMIEGRTFQRLTIADSAIPVWQIDDKLLESLRRRGCNEFHLSPDGPIPYEDHERLNVTEEGILSYCFTRDDDLPDGDGLTVPGSRFLRMTRVTLTPEFFTKVVESSKNSQLTCDVALYMDDIDLPFDVDNLDVGMPASLSREFEEGLWRNLANVRYNIADHGNGVRLLIHFRESEDREHWDVTVRHGKKEHEEFFEPTLIEEESDEDLEE
ncbi:hypothetical protein AAVH_08539 [Aphelenchoides avenae]|nr:hypothetical protein AAVH_08539 [Aphelenchus avenae]